MTADGNLLFGVLALQSELIDADQFAEACRLWSMHKAIPLADVLLQKGWIDPIDRTHLEYLVERKKQNCSVADGQQSASQALDGSKTPGSPEKIDIGRTIPESGRPSKSTEAPGVDPPYLSDRYQLERLHAAGGIGEIWLASDAHLNRKVAIKRLQPGNAVSDLDRSRFVREAQITGQLDHPGVVPVYELCLDDGSEQPTTRCDSSKGSQWRKP